MRVSTTMLFGISIFVHVLEMGLVSSIASFLLSTGDLPPCKEDFVPPDQDNLMLPYNPQSSKEVQ